MSATGALNILIYVIIIVIVIAVLLYILKVVLGAFFLIHIPLVSATFPAYTETGSGFSYPIKELGFSVIDADTSHFIYP